MRTISLENPTSPSMKGLTAEEVFNSLDFYSRWTIATGGTAFTTYEELGPTEEKRLNELVKAWRVSLPCFHTRDMDGRCHLCGAEVES